MVSIFLPAIQKVLNDKNVSQEHQGKTFTKNFLSSKPAEFYFGEIKKLPDKWEKVTQNNGQ